MAKKKLKLVDDDDDEWHCPPPPLDLDLDDEFWGKCQSQSFWDKDNLVSF